METTIIVNVPLSKKPGLFICRTVRVLWQVLSEVPFHEAWGASSYTSPAPTAPPRKGDCLLPSSQALAMSLLLVLIFSHNKLGLLHLNMFFISNPFSKPLSTRRERNVVAQVEQTTVGQTFWGRGGA